MMAWIISSSVLILGILVLRRLLRGRISLRLQYALWLVVLVRLLCPVNFFESSFSVQNAVESVREQTVSHSVVDEVQSDRPVNESPEWNGLVPDAPAENVENGMPDAAPEAEAPQQSVDHPVLEPAAAPELNWEMLAAIVWIVGAVVMLSFTVGCNFQFARMLARNRQELEMPGASVPVYVSSWVKTPCLVGVFRPVIYLTPEVAEDRSTWKHVIRHEMTHLEHFDHAFSLLRCLELCVHWYNPLVWIAARVSKEDAELACDEGTIARLGEGERIGYGQTLIRLTCRSRNPSDLMITATTMLGTHGGIRERIVCLAKKPKTLVYALVVGIIAIGLMVGCTFTGAVDDPEPTDPVGTTSPEETTVPPETTVPIETTVPAETTEPDVEANLEEWYEAYLAERNFEALGDDSFYWRGFVYNGSENVLEFEDVGLTLTIPEAWTDQVTIIRSGGMLDSAYYFSVINTRMSMEDMGRPDSPSAYALRISAVRKMYESRPNPASEYNYLGENNEFYFYYMTAEMSSGMDSPAMLKSLLIQEHGEDYYVDLVNDLIVQPEEVSGWVTIQDTSEEFVAEKPPQTLEGHPDFEWTGYLENYRYTGNSPVIEFPEWGFALNLPEEWMGSIDVIISTESWELFGLHVISREMAQAFADQGIVNMDYHQRTADYILRIYAQDHLSAPCWVLDSSNPEYYLCAVTRELYCSESNYGLGEYHNRMKNAIGQEAYDALVGDLIATEEMLREMIVVEGEGSFTLIEGY